jgi:hypothetical protein
MIDLSSNCDVIVEALKTGDVITGTKGKFLLLGKYGKTNLTTLILAKLRNDDNNCETPITPITLEECTPIKLKEYVGVLKSYKFHIWNDVAGTADKEGFYISVRAANRNEAIKKAVDRTAEQTIGNISKIELISECVIEVPG